MQSLKRAVKKGSKFQNPVETRLGGLSMMVKYLQQSFANREERVPVSPLGPFHTDASIYRQPPVTGLRVTWMGHSSVLLEIDGLRVLTDPVWEERASPLSWAGPKRFFPAPLSLSEMPVLDAILISHDHYDHLGKQTVQLLSQLEACKHTRWLCPLGVGSILRGFGVPDDKITELDWTDSATVRSRTTGASLAVTAVPTRHFSGRALWNRFETLWAAFVLKGETHRIYFGADSGYWSGYAAIGKIYGSFDLTMLEIGAFNTLWDSIHMGPEGAAEAFQALGATGLLMPIHWGLFDLALHGWSQPIQQILSIADRQGWKIWSPEPGEPSEVVVNQELRPTWWDSQKIHLLEKNSLSNPMHTTEM